MFGFYQGHKFLFDFVPRTHHCCAAFLLVEKSVNTIVVKVACISGLKGDGWAWTMVFTGGAHS
jgi:hypothetical protein